VERPILDDVTVVLPTLGRPILEETLLHLAGGDAWPGRLLVVDQSSSEEVAGWLRRLREAGLDAVHVPSSERGKSAALNRGFERASTRFVAVIDDDCFPDRAWLSRIRKELTANPGAVVTGPALPTGPEPTVAAVTLGTRSFSRRPGLRLDRFCGSNMGAAVDTIRRVGGFDEHPSFMAAAEDCDWAYRTLRAGVPIVYAPDVIVHHVGWRHAEERAERYDDYARGHGYFYGKHLRSGDWRIAVRIVMHHLRALRTWTRGALTGDREAVVLARAYLTGLLPAIRAGVRSRRRDHGRGA
jgi:GT2 family glycosyltransferase